MTSQSSPGAGASAGGMATPPSRTVTFGGPSSCESPTHLDSESSPAPVRVRGDNHTTPSTGGSTRPYHHRHRQRRPRSPSPFSSSEVHLQHQQQQHGHPFPYAASSSVADLTLLADLVDGRSGWCENKRMNDEQIEEACKGKSRAVRAELKEYYENMNYILDGWRQADVVVDSQFPAEVMRRFGTVQEVQQAWDRSAQYAGRHGQHQRRSAGGRPMRHRDAHPARSQSHTQLMHLLSTSASSTPDGGPGSGGFRPSFAVSSSDDDSGLDASRRRNRRPVVAGGDEESGFSTPRNGQMERRNSFGSRAANALGLGAFWFTNSNANSSANSAHVSREVTPTPTPPSGGGGGGGGARTPAKSRLMSEDESGFDSDSEPEPEPHEEQVGAGVGAAAAAAAHNRGERQALLGNGNGEATRGRKREPASQRQQDLTAMPRYGSTLDDKQAEGGSSGGSGGGNGNNGNNAVHAVRVLDRSPNSHDAIAIENAAPADTADEGPLDRKLKAQRKKQHLLQETKDVAAASPKKGSSATATSPTEDNPQSSSTVTPAPASITGGANSANEDEDRDKITDLPGGKREQERLALRRAVPGWEEKQEGEEKAVAFAININLLINILLLAGKAVAVLSSSSVSLLASFVDSALDLLSTLIIFAASKAVAFKSSESYFKYPRGKKNFEPLGVVIFSVLMIASFCQVLVESVQRLRTVLARGSGAGREGAGEADSDLPLIGIAFMVATIGIKTVMWLLYRRSRSAGVRAVAQDSQNDVVFNAFSLTFPFLGSRLGMPALDPIGGIVLSLYIISEWLSTLVEMTTKLSGARASPSDLARVLYIITRFKSVKSISACEVYYAGEDFVVEADIVLPVGMPLKQAHDLGEIVNYCVETLPGVERTFVHLDYNEAGQPAHISARG